MKTAFSGSDTIILDNRVLTDLADGDCVSLEYPEDIVNVTTGKNGNSIYAFNYAGEVVDVVIRVLRGSDDDKFLNAKVNLLKSNPAGFILMDGEFIKKIGDGKGNVTRDTYVLGGGVLTRGVGAKDSAAGDPEASIAIYNLKFTKSPRALG